MLTWSHQKFADEICSVQFTQHQNCCFGIFFAVRHNFRAMHDATSMFILPHQKFTSNLPSRSDVTICPCHLPPLMCSLDFTLMRIHMTAIDFIRDISENGMSCSDERPVAPPPPFSHIGISTMMTRHVQSRHMRDTVGHGHYEFAANKHTMQFRSILNAHSHESLLNHHHTILLTHERHKITMSTRGDGRGMGLRKGQHGVSVQF